MSRILLVNTGGLGRRVQKALAGMEVETSDLLEWESRARMNHLVKVKMHAFASALFRKRFHESYSIRAPTAAIQWEEVARKIVQEVELLEPELGNTLSLLRAEFEETNGKTGDPEDIHKRPQFYAQYKTAQCIVRVERRTHGKYLNRSADLFYLYLLGRKNLPNSCCVAGGTHAALELASILSDLGVLVCLCSDRILVDVETNIRAGILSAIQHKGVQVLAGIPAYKSEEKKTVLESPGQKESAVLPDIEEYVEVDEYSYAQKKEEEKLLITLHAPESAPGKAERDVLAGLLPEKKKDITEKTLFRLSLWPSLGYTTPSTASLGYTEAQTREKGWKTRISSPKFNPLFFSVSEYKVPAHYKLVIQQEEKEDGLEEKVVGVHLFGDDVHDIIKGFGIAVFSELTVADILKTVCIHPTSAEEVISI